MGTIDQRTEEERNLAWYNKLAEGRAAASWQETSRENRRRYLALVARHDAIVETARGVAEFLRGIAPDLARSSLELGDGCRSWAEALERDAEVEVDSSDLAADPA